jgi:hypothetical protein
MELEVGMGGTVTGESGTGVGGDKQILRLRDEKRTKENPPICLRKERGIAEGNCRIEKRRNPHANVARDATFKRSRRKLTRKQRGEMGEAAFMAVAAALGLRVAKPWGESSRYDLIVDTGKKLLRVQVKLAHRAGEYGGYTFHAHGNSSRVYGADEIDVLAAYVVPLGAWYLFPVEEFRKYKAMKLFPQAEGEDRSLRNFARLGGRWEWNWRVEALSFV